MYLECISFLGAAETNYHNWWLKTTENYSLTVLEGRSLKSRCWQGHTPSEISWGISVICTFQLLLAVPGVLLPCRFIILSLPGSSCGLVLCVSVSFRLLSLTRINVIGFRAPLGFQDDLTSRSLVLSAKTFFPNGETVRGSGDQDMSIYMGDRRYHHSTHYRRKENSHYQEADGRKGNEISPANFLGG